VQDGPVDNTIQKQCHGVHALSNANNMWSLMDFTDF